MQRVKRCHWIVVELVNVADPNRDWGGDCSTGTKQSPIDIDTSNTNAVVYDDFTFFSGYYTLQIGSVTNDGHSGIDKFPHRLIVIITILPQIFWHCQTARNYFTWNFHISVD